MKQCRNCPYGITDFVRRINMYNDIIKTYGIPNDIYGYLQPEDAAEHLESFLWCNKVGGKIYNCGTCTDAAVSEEYNKSSSRKKKKSKRERDLKYKNHLVKLEREMHNPDPVMYVIKKNSIGISKSYYKRLYRGKSSKKIKRRANKKVRHYKGEISNGGNYKRLAEFCYEYW